MFSMDLSMIYGLDYPDFLFNRELLTKKIMDSTYRNIIFYAAASYGNVETLEQVYKSGVNLNDTDQEGTSIGAAALLGLVRNNYNCNFDDNLKFLLSKGMDVNTMSSIGGTMTTVATNCGYTKRLEQILKIGGNPDLIDTFGKNALGHLVENSKEIAELLIDEKTDLTTFDHHGKNIILSLKNRKFDKVIDVIKLYQPSLL